MAKWTNKKKAEMNKRDNAGIEKFRHYAQPRGIFLNEVSLGFYKVVKRGRISQLEAVRAAVREEDGSTTLGWVINFANRQRKFVPDGGPVEVYPLGKKHLPKDGLFTAAGIAVPALVHVAPALELTDGKLAEGLATGLEII